MAVGREAGGDGLGDLGKGVGLDLRGDEGLKFRVGFDLGRCSPAVRASVRGKDILAGWKAC